MARDAPCTVTLWLQKQNTRSQITEDKGNQSQTQTKEKENSLYFFFHEGNI
jgi:hypothetical protein